MNKPLIRFDWAMKTLLRDKANFDILEGFLAALLEDEDIRILNLLESESNAEDDSDKFNRVDLLVEDGQKRKIFIEIQNTRETAYLKRLLYASSKIIVENQVLGENFKDVCKVISISILYFNLGLGEDYIYYGSTEFKGLNLNDKLILKNRINIAQSFDPKYRFVENNIFPEYYLITVERYKNVIKKKVDEWIYMIKNNEIAEGSHSKNIDKAETKLAFINMDKAEKRRYERHLEHIARDKDMIETAESKGRKEGRQENAIEIAQKAILKGLDDDTIHEITSLALDKIQSLRREIKKD